MIQAYNGQNDSTLVASSRSRFAAGGRVPLPTYKAIPEEILSRPDDFWARVDVDMLDGDECFPWKGCTDRDGYGITRRNFRAHRVAYVLAKGAIPDGHTIDHLCQNRRCCNPAHLEAVTASENVRRRREPTNQPSKYRPRKRTAARYARRRERGTCIQCNTSSVKYRCDRCRSIHNARQVGRKR